MREGVVDAAPPEYVSLDYCRALAFFAPLAIQTAKHWSAHEGMRLNTPTHGSKYIFRYVRTNSLIASSAESGQGKARSRGTRNWTLNVVPPPVLKRKIGVPEGHLHVSSQKVCSPPMSVPRSCQSAPFSVYSRRCWEVPFQTLAWCGLDIGLHVEHKAMSMAYSTNSFRRVGSLKPRVPNCGLNLIVLKPQQTLTHDTESQLPVQYTFLLHDPPTHAEYVIAIWLERPWVVPDFINRGQSRCSHGECYPDQLLDIV